MSARLQWFLFAVLVVAGFLFAWEVGVIPRHVPICTYNEHTHAEECTEYNILAAVFWYVGEGLNWLSPAITALATLLIAVFTLRLFKATFGLKESTDNLWKASERQIAAAQTAADAAAKSADTAERALTTIERAYLFFLDTVKIADNPQLEEPHFTVAFKNFGKSPAIISSFRIDIVPAARTRPPKPKETGTYRLMPPGAVIGPDSGWTRGQWPTSKLVQRLPLGQCLYLCGDIIYRDLLNDPIPRRTWFCRRLHPSGKFTLQNLHDPELNGYE